MSLRLFPEMRAGGFSAVDASVEFYGRVNALLRPDMVVLDFGAGRGKDAVDDPISYRRNLRILKGKVRLVIGADIDVAIAGNPSLDSAVLIDRRSALPFASESVDLIVCDFTFEHLAAPEAVAPELDRVLKPGGWVCARTPNRWGYIGVGATIVPNRYHQRVLDRSQPDRREEDVFPTVYRLNTRRAVERQFPPSRYLDCSYYFNSEPAYFGSSDALARTVRLASRLLPDRFSALIMVFLQKTSRPAGAVPSG